MNSCLYRCQVMHHRLTPREHKFSYEVFMFYFDLDEVEMLHRRFKLLSYNKFNWFNFRDRDHLQFPLGAGRNGKSVKQNVVDYLSSLGVEANGKIMLLTNVATMGYAFNPISFYLCFDKAGQPLCSIAEVCNTHGEMKLYLLDSGSLNAEVFQRVVSKYFYVSPFTDLAASFNFIFRVPDEKMLMRVDDYQAGKRFLVTSLTGERKEMSDFRLLVYAFRFPLITIKIIAAIYWQAFRLKLKKIPFQKKDFNLHLQQEKYQYK